MFDASQPINITIFSGGDKKCTVLFPADKDWKQRANRIRIRQESVSSGRSKSSAIGVEAAALELLSTIRQDTGEESEPFDGAEAAEVIGRLEFVELDTDDGGRGVAVANDRITVRIAALRHKKAGLFRGLTHVMKMPRQRQIADYRNNCIDTFGIKRGMETVQPLQAGEAFYDALVDKSEGYAGAVPVIHKDFVAMKVLEAIRDLEEGDDSPEA